MKIRVISKLDIKGHNLVKAVQLEGLEISVLKFLQKNMYEEGADEIVYQDIVASLYQRNSLSFIRDTSKNIFLPMLEVVLEILIKWKLY